MEKLDNYRNIVQQVLTNYAQLRSAYGCLIHLEIREGKIWVQYDGTEAGVANELVELGVPKQDIVLAYQSPFMRKFTQFAVS